MYNLTDNELLQYISDDVPYFDLTTYLQDKGDKRAVLSIFTREDIIVSCTEEVKRITELLNCKITKSHNSKASLAKGDTVLEFEGLYGDVHKAWRACQILLEYSCKISTYTNNMKKKIEKVNSSCELLTTRKSFPFAKKFSIKAIMIGGAMPHRLGLSETILLFPQHRSVYKNQEEFLDAIKEFKVKAPEKKVVVETEEFEDAVTLMKNGADALQVDKVELDVLKNIVDYKNRHFPNVKILAAGGINLNNVDEYAKTGINGVVTSAMYNCGMANLGSRMKILN
jgi:molybdenum transport protein